MSRAHGDLATHRRQSVGANHVLDGYRAAPAIAARLRAGTVNLDYPAWDVHAPFGGSKQSGNGREYADFGIVDDLELEAVVG